MSNSLAWVARNLSSSGLAAFTTPSSRQYTFTNCIRRVTLPQNVRSRHIKPGVAYGEWMMIVLQLIRVRHGWSSYIFAQKQQLIWIPSHHNIVFFPRVNTIYSIQWWSSSLSPQQVLTHFTDRNTFNDDGSQVKLRKRCDGIVVRHWLTFRE